MFLARHVENLKTLRGFPVRKLCTSENGVGVCCVGGIELGGRVGEFVALAAAGEEEVVGVGGAFGFADDYGFGVDGDGGWGWGGG